MKYENKNIINVFRAQIRQLRRETVTQDMVWKSPAVQHRKREVCLDEREGKDTTYKKP